MPQKEKNYVTIKHTRIVLFDFVFRSKNFERLYLANASWTGRATRPQGNAGATALAL